MDSPGVNSPPAATRWQRLRRKGGWGSAIACSLAVVSRDGRRPSATPDLASRLERPLGVSPGSGVSYAVAPPSQTMTEPVVKLEMSDAR